MASLLDLFVKIGIDDKEATKGIDALSKKGEGLSKVFKGAVGVIGAVTTAAVAVGGAFIKGAIATSEYGSNVNDLSQKMNISKKGFQEWSYILGQSGTDIGVLQMGLKTLSNAAVDGNEAFDKLGISQEQLSTLSTEELFNTTIAQLSEMEAGNERTALAADLFGRSATELLPILNEGADGLEKMRKQAEDYGLVMSDEAIAASDAFGDSVSLMQQTLTGMKNRMMGEFLPALTEVTDGLALLFTGDTSGLDKINKGISGFADKIAKAIPQIIEIGGSIVQTLATAIMNNMPLLVTAAFNLISSLSMFVLENLPMLLQTALTILMTLATGIAEQAPALLPAIVSTIIAMVNMLIDNMPMLIDAAVQLMSGLAQGILAALPVLVQAAPQIILSLINAIVENLPTLLASSADIIVAIVQGVLAALPQLVAAVPQILMALVKAFATLAPQLWNIGTNLIKGIWQGISNATSWLYGLLKGWVSNVLKYIKKLFGIKSPSTVMAEQIGKFLPQGVGVGIEKYAGAATSAMNGLMDSIMGKTYTPTINARVNATGATIASSTATGGGAAARAGASIGSINFYEPVTSPIQTANRINREIVSALYA